MTTCSNITSLKEVSKVNIRNTAFMTVKAAKIYCFWQGTTVFDNSFSKKIYSECYVAINK